MEERESAVVQAIENVCRKAKVAGKCDDCGGAIVRKLTGRCNYQPVYGDPACSNCNELYLGETEATTVGHEEFENLMNTPCGI